MTNAAVIPIPDRSADAIVGSNVKYLMVDRSVEQSDLARRIGIDQSTLSLKINGKRKWTVSELVTVSDIFDVSLDALARRRELGPVPGGGTHLVGIAPLRRGWASAKLDEKITVWSFASDHLAPVTPIRAEVA